MLPFLLIRIVEVRNVVLVFDCAIVVVQRSRIISAAFESRYYILIRLLLLLMISCAADYTKGQSIADARQLGFGGIAHLLNRREIVRKHSQQYPDC